MTDSGSSAELQISREIEEGIRALASTLSRLPEVERLRAARQAVNQSEAARIMLRDLRSRQEGLLRKEEAGEKPTAEEVEAFQKVAQVVGLNPYIRELMNAELAFSRVMAAVNMLVEKALQIPPVAGSEAQEEGRETEGAGAGTQTASGPRVTPQGSRVSPVRSRLWVPGKP